MRINKNVGLLVFLLIASVCLLQKLIAADSESREWETADGKYKVTATFKEFNEKENKVVLIKKDGKEVSVPVAKLSKKDQEHIKKATGNKKSDVDSFGQDDDAPADKSDKKQTEKKSADSDKPRAPDIKPDPVAEAKEPEPLSADDEKLAQELCKQLIAAYQPFKQPKWEKAWSDRVETKVLEADFSRDGNLMVSINGENQCVIRQLSDGKIIEKKDHEFSQNVKKTAISADGKYAATASNSGVVVWEIESGKLAFKHEAPKGDIAQIRFSRDGKTIAILDGEATLSRYPVLGGHGNVLDFDAKSDDRAHNQLGVSPDGKKYYLAKAGGRATAHIHLERRIANHPNSMSGYQLNKQNGVIVGGMASDDYYLNLDNMGVLSWSFCETLLPHEKQTFRARQTTLPIISARGVNSWDGKYCALVSHHAILGFPTHNPALWRVIVPPAPNLDDHGFWLLSDFEHALTLDNERNLTFWKASFKDQLIDVPLVRELVAQKKYNVIDRAYLILDHGTEYAKQSIIESWSDRLFSLFNDAVEIEIAKTDSSTVADFVNWNKTTPNNTLGRILAAKYARQTAWQARGTGAANSVTEEGWKIYTKEMGNARKAVAPLLKRKQVPSEAISLWIAICQASGWEKDDVDLAIKCLMRDHPIDKAIQCSIAFNLLPRWYGTPGDVESYADMISDKVDPEFKEIIYMTAIGSVTRPRRMAVPGFIFNDEKNPVYVYDNVTIEWDRMLLGADQLATLFPADPAGPTLGLLYSVQSSNKDATKKYLKILDDKFAGVIAPNCRITMADVHFIRLELANE